MTVVYTLYLIEKDIRFCVLYKIGSLGFEFFKQKKSTQNINSVCAFSIHLRKRQVSK